MVFLQFAVERITGKKLNKYMQDVVFGPLGMKHSSFVWNASFDDDEATGHNSGGTPVELPKVEQSNAASSLETTAEDYAIFLEAILAGKGLRPSTLREMETPQIAVETDCITCVENPQTGKPSEEIFWGLGFGIEKTAERQTLWHWGDYNVFKAFFAVRPDTKDGVVYLTNSENGLLPGPEIVAATFEGAQPVFSWLNHAK
jgi:CubicO group peptidase (beta-lactamase class C family)